MNPDPIPRSFNRIHRIGLALASGVMLFLAYPSFDFSSLAWIAFIPLLYAIEGCSAAQAYRLGTVTGLVAACGGFYWFADWAVTAMELTFPLNQLAMLGHSFYVAQLFGLTFLLLQWLRRKKAPGGLLLFPLIWVTVISLFPLVFRFTLGDGQTGCLAGIQAVELTGVYGLDFAVTLVNGLLYQALRAENLQRRLIWLGIVVLWAGGWWGYGLATLADWSKQIEGWPSKRIGIVQPNRPVSLTRPKPEPGYSLLYPLDLAMTLQLASQKPDLVVWPEGHFYGTSFWPEVKASFSQHIRQLGIPLVLFDTTQQTVDDINHYFNSSLWIDKDGHFGDPYHKIKLVPFGEYFPLLDFVPFVRDWLEGFLSELTPGKEHRVFAIAGMNIVPKICYEPLFPEYIAESLQGRAQGAVLLVQSQDGWYGRSSQPEQHLAVTVLRAVENRVPLIHVINNGPSAIILPTGRVIYRSEPFTRGAWVAEMPYHQNSGGGIYTRSPWLFINFVRLLLVLVLSLQILVRRKRP